jgi:hypothetical protein
MREDVLGRGVIVDGKAPSVQNICSGACQS